ncbi:hypothetical protein [Vibrio sp. J383]|uniref:hypothetical protein n=1 Tax=Vibrio sp. J383 TaxID=2942997 RepID=UPI0020BE48E1|nr:hypothetical protein [Vibrio sp. J383]UQV21857.1 hypothetical protein M4S28_02350 [Vibrio sp. J383]
MKKFINAIKTIRSAILVKDEKPDYISENSILFGCHDVNRSMKENGNFYSPILEGVKSLLIGKYDFVNISHPFAILSSGKVKGGSITLNYKFLAMRVKLFFSSILGLKNYDYYRTELELQIYSDLLEKINPLMIISIQPPLGLCKAARLRGIKVVELMHFNNISSHDDIFTKHFSLPDELLPNVILSFDQCSYKTVSGLCEGRDIISYQTEDAWYNHLMFNKDKDKDKDKNELKSIIDDFDKVILVSLQWGYDGERDRLSNIIPNGIVHPAIEDLIQESNKDTLFLIRLHPIQILRPWYRHHVEHVRALAKKHKNVEFEMSSDLPLHYILDDVDVHLTMSSSCVGEAAIAKVPSLLLCPSLKLGNENYGLFRELESEGYVTFGELNKKYIQKWVNISCKQASKDIYNVEEVRNSLKAFYFDLIENKD